MQTFISIIIAIIAIIHLGDIASHDTKLTADNQRPNTLFSIDNDYGQSFEASQTGLWESSIVEVNNQEVQLRWEKRDGYITVAKSCTVNGETVVAQATIKMNDSKETATSKIHFADTTCEISLNASSDNSLLIEDEAFIFTGETAEGAQEFTVLVDDQTEIDGTLTKIEG